MSLTGVKKHPDEVKESGLRRLAQMACCEGARLEITTMYGRWFNSFKTVNSNSGSIRGCVLLLLQFQALRCV